MKVVMLVFSARPDGRTYQLAAECARGAVDSGHQVSIYCISGASIIDDPNGGDKSAEFYAELDVCDALVFAAPYYRWGVFVRLTGNIVRRALGQTEDSGRRCALLVTSTKNSNEASRAKLYLSVKIAGRCGWIDRGFLATQSEESPESRERDFLQAYTIGSEL